MKLENQPIDELQMRVNIASALIGMLRQDDDPRAPRAIEVLQDQQRQINEVLVQKIQEERETRGKPEPPAVVIGMKPVAMQARALRR